MQYLFQSVFLQSLGYAIANSLWQTALLWLVYLLLNCLLKLSAAQKYRMAVTVQVAGFLWFIITLQFYYSQYASLLPRQVYPGASIQDVNSLFAAGSGFRSQLIGWMIRAEQLLPYLSAAYLLLMAFLCIRWISGYHQTQQVRYNGLHKIPAQWRIFVKDIAAMLEIKQQVNIYLSNKVATPLTIGFFKPLILVPVASINHLTVAQLEAVILHEMAHIKRYDYLVNMILSTVEITLFFNPFTQLLSKTIKKERENSCDDWVLQFQYSATTYAEALLRIAHLQHTPAFAMAATGNTNDLLARVKRMIGKKENRFNYGRQLLAFLLVTGILSSIAWLNPGTANAKQKDPATTGKQAALPTKIQPVVIEPMAMKVDNPLFNPAFFLTGSLQQEMKQQLDKASQELNKAFSGKKFTESVASIPSLVHDAMQEMKEELAADKVNREKEAADMELAKLNAEKAWQIDSSALAASMRIPFKDALYHPVGKIESDLKKAKLEIEKALRLKALATIDEAKIKQDIAFAFEDIRQFNFDQLISNSFETVSKTVFNNRIQLHRPTQENIPGNKRHRLKKDGISPATPADEAANEDGVDVHPEAEEPVGLVKINPDLVLSLKELKIILKEVDIDRLLHDVEKIKQTTQPLMQKEKARIQQQEEKKRIVIELK